MSFQNCMAKMFRCVKPSPTSAQRRRRYLFQPPRRDRTVADGDGIAFDVQSLTEDYDIVSA